MPTEPDDDTAAELAELHQEKEEQVLEREPLETELMDEGRSEAGEGMDHVQDE
ncbi:MAG: hypothetical protein ABR511_09660 [Acidimicrobiales bacterium]